MPTAVKSAFSVEGEGEPIFLIHGIGASRASFAGLVPHLKNEYRVISYDLRGHGASPKPTPPYTLDDLVEDLEALRKELGIEKAHFAGHSLGGMIGPAYARKYPQHVLSVGLYATPPSAPRMTAPRSRALSPPCAPRASRRCSRR